MAGRHAPGPNHVVARRRYVARMKTTLDAFVVEEKAKERAELERIGAELRQHTDDVRPVFRRAAR